MMKKTWTLILTVSAVLAAISCQRESLSGESGRVVPVVPVNLSVQAVPYEGESTKSRIDSDTESIRRAMLFAMGADGKILLREDTGGGTSPVVATVDASHAHSFEWSIPLGTSTVFTLANYDDALQTVLEGYASDKNLTVSTLESLTYTNNESSFLTSIPARGMPMAGVSTVTVTASGQTLRFPVKKLFARYDISFDTSAFSDAGYTVTTTAIEGLSSPSSAYWFREGQAPAGAGYVNLDYATQADLAAVSSAGCTLYLLENCQGDKSGFDHWYDVQFAGSSVLSGLTHLLIKTTYADAGGHLRKAVCRVYLGSDCRTNFDVRRGVKTSLHLRLRPGIGKEVYLGDGGTLVAGPFATISVPYETTLNDPARLSFASNSDITFQNFTFAAKSGGQHPECGYGGTVTYVANGNARAATFSHLSVSGEGATDICDEAQVYFPYSFRYAWENGAAPDHVAQRNLLHCIDNYTGLDSSAGLFSVKDAAKVRLVSNGDGTAWVSLIGPFSPASDAIGIETAGGEGHADIPLEARLPYFSCTAPGTTYVDAPSSMTYTYFRADGAGNQSASAMILCPEETSPAATGSLLNRELVEELIPPYVNSEDGRIGHECLYEADGSCTLNVWLKTYAGLSSQAASTESSFQADRVVVGMTRYNTLGNAYYRGLTEAPFTVWNPWKNINRTEPVQAGVLNDYTLYCEPAPSSSGLAGVGWSQTAVRPFGEDQENVSVSIQKPILSQSGHTQIQGRFADGAGTVGSIFSGSPGRTDANGGLSEWQLTFALKGCTAAQMGTHNAGKLQVMLRITNAHDSSVLEKVIAEAYMRLHLYVWPAVGGPYEGTDGQGFTGYKRFKVFPYANTRGYEIYGLEADLPRNGAPFFQIPVMDVHSQISTHGAGICDYLGTLANQGVICRSAPVPNLTAEFSAPENVTFGSGSDSEATRKENLRRALNMTDPPLLFLPSENVTRDGQTLYGLNHFLGSGHYTRADDFTLYYDPSGSDRTYSYGTGASSQLFVFHLGTGFDNWDSHYYFGPENGF